MPIPRAAYSFGVAYFAHYYTKSLAEYAAKNSRGSPQRARARGRKYSYMPDGVDDVVNTGVVRSVLARLRLLRAEGRVDDADAAEATLLRGGVVVDVVNGTEERVAADDRALDGIEARALEREPDGEHRGVWSRRYAAQGESSMGTRTRRWRRRWSLAPPQLELPDAVTTAADSLGGASRSAVIAEPDAVPGVSEGGGGVRSSELGTGGGSAGVAVGGVDNRVDGVAVAADEHTKQRSRSRRRRVRRAKQKVADDADAHAM
jgi:hypothetical protein